MRAHVGHHRFLDLSFNDLTALPDALARCALLSALSLAFNPLGPALSTVLCRLGALQELNIDYTGACGGGGRSTPVYGVG